MAQGKKIPKEVAKDIAKRTVTVEVYGGRTTTKKGGEKAANPKIVFGLAGVKDVSDAEKAGYPIVSIYGLATHFDEGDILEVTIKPKVQAK